MPLWKVKAEDTVAKDTLYVEAVQASDAIRIVLDTTSWRCEDIRSVKWLDENVRR